MDLRDIIELKVKPSIPQPLWENWYIKEKIGTGSFSVVYRIEAQRPGDLYVAALKIEVITSDGQIFSDISRKTTFLNNRKQMAINEVQIMKKLRDCPFIVRYEEEHIKELYIDGKFEGYYYLIRMELLQNVFEMMKNGTFSFTEANVRKLASEIGQGIKAAHSIGVIHRDIKPDNMFVNKAGVYKLGDFNISKKAVSTRTFAGTQYYMAPEIYRAKSNVDSSYTTQADIYSFGLCLYQMMNNGQLPFEDTLDPDVAYEERMSNKTSFSDPCNASLEFSKIILKACAYDLNKRYKSIDEMMSELSAISRTSKDRKTQYAEQSDFGYNTHDKNMTQYADDNTGHSSQHKPSKNKWSAVIIAILIIMLLVGVGIFAVSKLFSGNNSSEHNEPSDVSTSEIDDYFKSDEEQIKAIINDADFLAIKEDYEGALIKVQAGLVTYPKSAELQAKAGEYTEALNAQVKAKTLDEAKNLADSDDYVSAIALIKDAQESQGDDADYQSALNTYSNAFKNEVITSADALAANGNYIDAFKKVETASAVIGEDAELSDKANEYENEYAKNISSQVDDLLAENDVASAKSLLQTASKEFPSNNIIKSRVEEINKYKTVALSTLTPINGEFKWNEGTPEDPFGNTYTDILNYCIFHASSNGFYGHRYEENYSSEYKLDGEYNYISFMISPYSDFEETGKSFVQVYVDNVLRYTTPAITQKSEPFETPIIDISDAEYIKIKVNVGGSGCIMLSDVTLGNMPEISDNLIDDTTSISILDAFNGSIPWENEYPSSMIDCDYTHSQNYAVLHASSNGFYGHKYAEEYSAEYYIAKKYSTISMSIAPAKDFSESSSTCVKIYVDNNLVYTSPNVTQKTMNFNTGDIDIINADYVKIVVEVGGGGCTIISDVLLKNTS